jgi:hypothetical protein
MQVPKVTRQVIRMSASDAVKAGYVRGNAGWRGVGGVSNSSWAAAGGETRREPSGSSTWDKAASQTLRTGTELSEANGSESNMSSVQTMTAAAGNGGGIMQPAVDDGVVLTDKNNIALDPYVPGMLRTKPRPPGIKVLQHVPVASPQQNTQQYHRHDAGLRVSGSGGGGVESSSSQGTPARVIQPVRVHARPPQLLESPVRDMKQVEDSLSSLLSGLGSGRGMGPPSPVKKGIHTLEKTLQVCMVHQYLCAVTPLIWCRRRFSESISCRWSEFLLPLSSGRAFGPPSAPIWPRILSHVNRRGGFLRLQALEGRVVGFFGYRDALEGCIKHPGRPQARIRNQEKKFHHCKNPCLSDGISQWWNFIFSTHPSGGNAPSPFCRDVQDGVAAAEAVGPSRVQAGRPDVTQGPCSCGAKDRCRR